jgi:hypothetical protein
VFIDRQGNVVAVERSAMSEREFDQLLSKAQG